MGRLGHYGLNGAEAFVRKYGYIRGDGVFYFTGTHKVNTRHIRTGQMLTLEGFDSAKGKITNVDGGICLTVSRVGLLLFSPAVRPCPYAAPLRRAASNTLTMLRSLPL